MSTLIWVIEGPAAGQFLEASEEEAEQAEKEGWAEKAQGRDGYAFSYAKAPGPHAKAEAFLAKRPGYATRELRPETNPAPEPEPAKQEKTKPAKQETKADEETPTEEPASTETTAAKPAAKSK